MNLLLRLSGWVDAMTEAVGKIAVWFVLVDVLISASNALMRYTFNYSSNAYLEIQWYVFGLIFLLCAGYTFLHNEHIRIDVVASRFSRRTQIGIDIFGILFFLLPMACLVVSLSWPVFVQAFVSGEMSNSEGGLIVWPARLMIPVGFMLLILQALSELIKRVGFLMGRCPDPTEKKDKTSAEEALAQAIRAQSGERS